MRKITISLPPGLLRALGPSTAHQQIKITSILRQAVGRKSSLPLNQPELSRLPLGELLRRTAPSPLRPRDPARELFD
ncbi:MAG: hypothetical protein ACQKBY_06905 [Verrucomicrobiales bacterium]